MRRKMIYRLLQHSSSSTSHGAPGTTSGMMTCKPACANHAVGISGGHCRFSTVTGYRHTRPLIPAAALNLFHCSRVCNTPMQRSLISSRNFLRSACTASEIHITAAATYTEQQTDVRSSTVATTLSETSSAAGLPAAAVPVPGTLAALLANPPPGNVLDTWRLFLRTIHQLGHFPSTATDIELAIQQQADVKAALLNFARRRPDIIFSISSGELTALAEIKMQRGDGADLDRKLKNADRRLKETFLLNKHDDGASHASLQDLLRVVWEWVQTPESTLNRVAPGLPVLLGMLLRQVTMQSLSPPAALALERSKKLATPNVEELQALKAGLSSVQDRKKVEADIFMQRRHKMRLRNAAASTILELGDWFCSMCGNVNWRNKKQCMKCSLPCTSLGNTAIVAQDISDLYGAGNRAPERNAPRNTDLDSAFGSLTTPRRSTPTTSSSPSSSSREEASEPSAQKKGSSSKSSREASAKSAAEGRAAAAAADDELMAWDKPVVRRQLQLTRVVPAATASASGRGVGRAAAAERQRGLSQEGDEDDDDGEEAEQDDDDGDGGRDVQRRRGSGAKGGVNRQASAGRREEEQDYGGSSSANSRPSRPSSRQSLRDEDADDGGGGGRERGSGRNERREARGEETALFSRQSGRSEGRGRGAATSEAGEGEDDDREEQRGAVVREQHSAFYEGGRRAERGVRGDQGEPYTGRESGGSNRFGGDRDGPRGSSRGYGEGVEVSRGGGREDGRGRIEDGDDDGEEKGYGGGRGGRGRGGGRGGRGRGGRGARDSGY